jgi:hypothetical protein
MAEVTDASASDEMDAVIELIVANGTPPYEYSIDQGNTFQASPIFSGLGAGQYELLVIDGIGCSSVLEVVVDVMVSTSNRTVGSSIEVLPNPTDGLFRINIKGLSQSGYLLPLEIYNASGQLIQHSNLTRYDDTFTGLLSLYAYPDGLYFVRFKSDEIGRMVKVVKQ